MQKCIAKNAFSLKFPLIRYVLGSYLLLLKRGATKQAYSSNEIVLTELLFYSNYDQINSPLCSKALVAEQTTTVNNPSLALVKSLHE